MQPSNFPTDNVPNEPQAATEQQLATPARERKTIVVCDVVESVRWMEHDEDLAITRWQAFTRHVRENVVPACAGNVVKSTGDGLVMEFSNARQAIEASNAMHRFAAFGNQGAPAERQLHLRTGIHEAQIRRDAHDIYGHGVNLAARITTLAGPDEIIVSAAVRDQLTDGVDADIEDLGDCFLKNVSEPQRVYRVGAAGVQPVLMPAAAMQLERGPTVAVMPLAARFATQDERFIGDLFADLVINGLSRSSFLTVISRLSTSAMAGRQLSLAELGASLRAEYVVSGSYSVLGGKVQLLVELAHVESGTAEWSNVMSCELQALCQPNCEPVAQTVECIAQQVLEHELARTDGVGFPSLASYGLLLGAVNLMHRASQREFDKPQAMLEHLVDRHRRSAQPYAWLANLFALRVTQGQSANPKMDCDRALSFARNAIERDPTSSLAWAIEGVLQINLKRDLAAAAFSLEKAVSVNPNDALAWLYSGLLHGFKGEGEQATQASETALGLSPVDPLRHYMDTLAATAALGAGCYDRAIELAKRSMKGNRTHPSTFRTLAVAQQLSGRASEAQATVRGLLELVPGYTLSDFKANSAFCLGPHRELFIDALRDSGVPD
jgi:adenylate cyclase